jgi:hypothetical protein
MSSAVARVGGVFEFYGIADHTRTFDGTFDRHWDLVAWSTLRRSQIGQIKREVARKLSIEFGGPVRITFPKLRPSEIHGRSRYISKAENLGETRYIFLPARDGSRLVWSSGGFFGGRGKEEVWEELVALWNAQRRVPPKQKIDVGTGIWIFDISVCEWWELKGMVEVRPDPITYTNISTDSKLTSILPADPRKAVGLGWLAWMTGDQVGDLVETLPNIPGIQRTAEGGWWIPARQKNQQPQLYHKDYVEVEVDWDKEVHKIVQLMHLKED